jgi:hypothetical protein
VGDAPPAFAAAGGSRVKIVGARITPAAAGAVVVPKGSSITTIKQLVKIDTTVINAEQKLVDAFYKAGEIPTDGKMTGYMTGQFNSTVTGSATTSAGGSVTGGGS